MDGEVGEQKPRYRYHRRSVRLPKHDYRWTRGYFVTVRASTHDPIFEFPALHAILQDAILQEMWDALPQRFPGVTLDAFVIMPDHIHGILWLNGLVENAPTLGRVIGTYNTNLRSEWYKRGNDGEREKTCIGNESHTSRCSLCIGRSQTAHENGSTLLGSRTLGDH